MESCGTFLLQMEAFPTEKSRKCRALGTLGVGGAYSNKGRLGPGPFLPSPSPLLGPQPSVEMTTIHSGPLEDPSINAILYLLRPRGHVLVSPPPTSYLLPAAAICSLLLCS